MDVLARLRQAIGSVPIIASNEDPASNSAAQSDDDSAAGSSSSKAETKTPTQSARTSATGRRQPVIAGRSFRRGEKSTALAFRDNWLALRSTLATPDQAALHHGVTRTDAAVRLQDLCDALVFETNRADEDADIAGPCMEMLLEGDMLGQLVKWTANDRIAGSQAEVVRLFASLIILLDERFLSRQAVHRPLVRLMRICVGDEFFSTNPTIFDAQNDIGTETSSTPNEDEEKHAQRRFGRLGSAEALGFEEQLVDMMCHVASRLRNTPELLIIFFRERGGDEQTRHAFNMAMSSSAMGTPSRVSTRAPSPSGSSNPAIASLTRSSQPAVSSPLRPPESLPLPTSSPLSFGSGSRGGATSQASSSLGLSYDFPLFSYLMRFVHRESRTGELARAGILFLVDVAFAPGRRNLARHARSSGRTSLGRSSGHAVAAAAGSPRSARINGGRRSGSGTPQRARIDVDLGLGPSIALARFMLESDFAEVLGAGVGAVYGLLPTKLASSSRHRATDDVDVRGRRESERSEATLVGQGEAMILGDDGNGSNARSPLSNVALSSSDEVRNQARLLCDLLEFTQDILRTTVRVASDRGVGLGIDDGGGRKLPTSSELMMIANSLTSSVSSDVETLFLENILYPSMLESSDVDGSSIAVLSYLDAMLSVLEPDTALTKSIVGWLVGSDSIEAPLKSNNASKDRKQKRKSTAMLQLEKEKGGQANRETSSYFSDVLGRYTVRDLIVDNIQSTTNDMARVAAMRLVSTLFTFHGCFTLTNVIRVDLDDFATAFPTNLIAAVKAGEGEGEDEDEAGDTFKIDDEDSEEFVYPGGAKDEQLFDQRLRRLARTAVAGSNVLQFSNEIEMYVSLIGMIEHGRGESRTNAPPSTQSTGFDNYLDDAEIGITQDSMYIAVMRDLLNELPVADNGLEAIAAGQQGSSKHDDLHLSPDSGQSTSMCFRHRLNAHDRLLRNVLSNLCRFWQNKPEVNVALTGFLAVLAMCPLRSLEGFLTFPRTHESQEVLIYQENGSDATTAFETDEEAQDDRSDDEREFALRSESAHKKERNTKSKAGRSAKIVPMVNLRSTEAPIIVCILRALVMQLEHHRREIEDFDHFLHERRRGLLFVENLNEALRLSDLISVGADEKDQDAMPTPLNVFSKISASNEKQDFWATFGDVAHIEPIEISKKDKPLRKARLSLPPPPSATPSQGIISGEADRIQTATVAFDKGDEPTTEKTQKPLAERSAFARFFGRPSAKSAKSTEEDGAEDTWQNRLDTGKATNQTTQNAPPPKPFAQHYLQTSSLTVDVKAVRLASTSPWSTRYDASAVATHSRLDNDDDDAEEKARLVNMATTKRTRFRDADAGSDSETEKFTYPGVEDVVEKEKVGEQREIGKKKNKKASSMKQKGMATTEPSMTLSTMLDNVVILEEAIKELVAILHVRRAMGIDAVSFV